MLTKPLDRGEISTLVSSPAPRITPLGEPFTMRFALLGDVHASPHLAAALDFARDQRVDQVLCVGDLCDGPGSLPDTVALLRSQTAVSVLCVRGNHDRWLLEDRMRDFSDAHFVKDISEEDRRWLAALPAVRELETGSSGGPTLVLAHGLFDNDMTFVRSHTTEHEVRDTPAWERGRKTFSRARWHVAGHTHERMVRTIDGLVMINAGTLHPAQDPGLVLFDTAEHFVRSFDVTREGAIAFRETLSLS